MEPYTGWVKKKWDLKKLQIALNHSILKLKSILIPPDKVLSEVEKNMHRIKILFGTFLWLSDQIYLWQFIQTPCRSLCSKISGAFQMPPQSNGAMVSNKVYGWYSMGFSLYVHFSCQEVAPVSRLRSHTSPGGRGRRTGRWQQQRLARWRGARGCAMTRWDSLNKNVDVEVI